MSTLQVNAELRISQKAGRFTESVIREMTRLALEHSAINLAQGFPDFPAPDEVKDAAMRAIAANINQYAITWGAREFRRAIAERFQKDTGLEVDPEREITVTCGATEAMIASLLAVVDPGDEVVVFEPFYENYGPDAVICGATPRFVRLEPPEWVFDPNELRAAINDRTRAVILNTPNNPTGKVFSRNELELIAEAVLGSGAYVITDEIYQYMTYDGVRHVSMSTLPGMRERTITLNALSKTYSVTGWRVGYAIAAPEVTSAIRKMHDFLTVGAAAPLQDAGVTALRLPEEYYRQLALAYKRRRDRTLESLTSAGFKCYKPKGAYYVMTDISAFRFNDDIEFARHLVHDIGVAVGAGQQFLSRRDAGSPAGPLLLFEAGRHAGPSRAPAAEAESIPLILNDLIYDIAEAPSPQDGPRTVVSGSPSDSKARRGESFSGGSLIVSRRASGL